MTPLSGSLPARSSQGERGKMPQAFCVPNTIGWQPAKRQARQPALRRWEGPPILVTQTALSAVSPTASRRGGRWSETREWSQCTENSVVPSMNLAFDVPPFGGASR